MNYFNPLSSVTPKQFQEKWVPLFGPKLRKTEESRPIPDSVKSGIALAASAAILLVVGSLATADAASPEYCTVFAQASADPKGAASDSAADTETLQRVYDKAYFECLNADDEPAIPDEFLARAANDLVVSEGDTDTGDEGPVVRKSTDARTASAEPRKKKKWKSGFPTGTAGWQAWCEENYKSFDVKSGTYTSFSGEKKPCK